MQNITNICFNKINAIKALRTQWGLGLIVAKDVVEMVAQHIIVTEQRLCDMGETHLADRSLQGEQPGRPPYRMCIKEGYTVSFVPDEGPEVFVRLTGDGHLYISSHTNTVYLDTKEFRLV